MYYLQRPQVDQPPGFPGAVQLAYGGVYLSCELCLAWMNALASGEPDAEIDL